MPAELANTLCGCPAEALDRASGMEGRGGRVSWKDCAGLSPMLVESSREGAADAEAAWSLSGVRKIPSEICAPCHNDIEHHLMHMRLEPAQHKSASACCSSLVQYQSQESRAPISTSLHLLKQPYLPWKTIASAKIRPAPSRANALLAEICFRTPSPTDGTMLLQ